MVVVSGDHSVVVSGFQAVVVSGKEVVVVIVEVEAALQEVSDSSPWAAKANLGGLPPTHPSPVLPKNPHIVLVLGACGIASQLASLPFVDDIRAAVIVDPAVVFSIRTA